MVSISEFKKFGWVLEVSDVDDLQLPIKIIDRYHNIPSSLYAFINRYSCFISPNEKSWFLTCLDFNKVSDSVYNWNEWEVSSLEDAVDDEFWKNEISKFWDNHFPFFMSVDGGYSYLAVRQDDGVVIWGEEPEYENTANVADSYDSFISIMEDNPNNFLEIIRNIVNN